MKTVEAHEAETHFSDLLAEVAAGETVEITDRGVVVARIVPVAEEAVALDFADASAAIEEWERYRDEHHVRLGGVTIRDLIEDGRK